MRYFEKYDARDHVDVFWDTSTNTTPKNATRIVTAKGAVGHCSCSKCGGRIDVCDAFCRHCGSRLTETRYGGES